MMNKKKIIPSSCFISKYRMLYCPSVDHASYFTVWGSTWLMVNQKKYDQGPFILVIFSSYWCISILYFCHILEGNTSNSSDKPSDTCCLVSHLIRVSGARTSSTLAEMMMSSSPRSPSLSHAQSLSLRSPEIESYKLSQLSLSCHTSCHQK